jgi:hypothetical protein
VSLALLLLSCLTVHQLAICTCSSYSVAGLSSFIDPPPGPLQEFYDTLARCRAILPAFSSAQYLVSKSSSTTATAINVATPLVAESR